MEESEALSFRTIVKILLYSIVFMLLTLYVVFQARYLIAGPQVRLDDDTPLQQNQRQVFLTGDAHNISHLWLNDRPIYTDTSGKFKEALILENGYTIATLRAKDRYGRETRVAKRFVYTPASFF